MRKIWIMGGVAVAALGVAMAGAPQPARSSQDWLAKAQSEFATKARDAVFQRRLAPATSSEATQDVASAVELAPSKPLPSSSYQVASLDPVPPRMPVTATVPMVAEVPAALPAPIERSVETRVATSSSEGFSAAPSVSNGVGTVAPKALDVARTLDVVAQPQPTVAAPPAVVPAAVTAAPVQPTIKPVAAQPTVAAKSPAPAAHKTRQASNQPAATRSPRREPGTGIDARSMETLRSHAPEIAAMIGRYM